MRPCSVSYSDVYPILNAFDAAEDEGYSGTIRDEDFRLPALGEYYVTPEGKIAQKELGDSGPYGPRLIVRPLPLNEIQKEYGKDCKTIQDVWERCPPVDPYSCFAKEDYEPDEFRDPKYGEIVVSSGFSLYQTWRPNAKRLVLRKKDRRTEFEKKLEEIYGCLYPSVKIPEGYESTGEIRRAESGEYWLNHGGGGWTAEKAEAWGTAYKWPILRKKEEKPEYELVFDYEEMRQAIGSVLSPRYGEGWYHTVHVLNHECQNLTAIAGMVREKKKA